MCTGKEVPSFSGSKVIAQTHRQTDFTEIITYPHTQIVTSQVCIHSRMYVAQFSKPWLN